MTEGYYDVEVHLAHHKSVTKQIQVIAGQSQEITLNPTPIYGSLDVTSTPHDAEVTIDGKLYGKTPLTIEQLLEGEHKIVISKSQYASVTRTINISENNNSSIESTLEATLKDIPPSSQKRALTANGGQTFTVGAKDADVKSEAEIEEANKKYNNMDARIRVGPYRIVGTDKVVKVKEGDDLVKISRRILGPDMECYIEVYNDLKASSELKV